MILVSNVLISPGDVTSIYITGAILLANLVSYVLRHRYPVVSIVIVVLVVLILMAYHRTVFPGGSISLSAVLIIGFIVSILLKGKIMWVMHFLAFLILNTIFIIHAENRITAAIAYSTLYIILTYAAGMLKFNYDRINQRLKDTNIELNKKADEVAHQNSELLQVQGHLNSLNTHLEKIVDERTAKIQEQNKLLIKYSHANAHHLRGPVARMLGLGSIYSLDTTINLDFVIQKMLDEARDIDSVIKRLSTELNNDLNNAPL